ncbi:hypothetical protein L226DRAFT_527577 [Lentinus tigrinus ALCF2SS1-7]|uniref:uncharacterized protein n=1 Tax=Lentinus tigrinus ALCF2SS1-7 TaxID=1328758 RepID=UPI001165CF4C|nr:hypothetical protein L226DRAFT_527577 [Lentinus tigrinus ALCF2SS1-7]
MSASANPITQSAPRKKKEKSVNDDPTEGDGRRWAMGAKFAFLSGRLSLWRDARELGEMSTFYSRLTLLFIRYFTWERALDPDGNGPTEEPSEDNLDEVLDVTGLEPDEIRRRNEVYLELRNKLQRWYRYHGTKLVKSKGVDPLSKIVAQAGAKGAPPPKRIKHQNSVVSRMFAAETGDFQAALKAQRDAEFDEELAAWKASSLDLDDETPKTAEEYNLALSEAKGWLPQFADSLAKRLGLNVSILLTGPIGDSGGRIDVKGCSVHAGTTLGLTPKLWPTYDVHGYEALVKSMVAHGKACFSSHHVRTTHSPIPGSPGPSGGRRYPTPTMPSPLRMVSRLPSSQVAPSNQPNSGPAIEDAVEKGSARPPAKPEASNDTAIPDPAPSSTSSATSRLEHSAPDPMTPSASTPPLPPATAQSATPRARRPGLSQPPPSSSPTTLSPTPPTERSTQLTQSPTSASVSVPARGRPKAVSSHPSRTTVPSISAGPATTISPGLLFSLSTSTPTSISAGPLLSLSAGPRSTAFSKIDSTNCPPNVVAIIDYLSSHQWGAVWTHCIATFVEIERFAQFKSRGTLLNSTDGRPPEVADWMKRHRKLVDVTIRDVDKFAEGWARWWKGNKPVPSSEDDDEVPANLDWSVLYVSGPNGLLLFILTLAWWGTAVAEDDTRHGKWLVAMSDVRLVFDRVLLAASRCQGGDDSDGGDGGDSGPKRTTYRKRRRAPTITLSAAPAPRPKKAKASNNK